MTTAHWRSLSVLREGHIVEVVLSGPGKGNAMGPDFWREMPLLFAELDRDEHCRCVIVRGANGEFSFGLDLPAMVGELGPVLAGGQLAAGRQKLLEVIHQMQSACDGVARCRKPVLAAVAGRCIGGGLDLAAACDVRYCSADAVFSLREVKLAMVADVGSLQRLPWIIGEGATRELAFTGRDIDAMRALHLGLVSEVHGSETELLVATRATAAEIAANSPLAVQGIKQVMNDGQGRPLAESLRQVAIWNAAFLQSNDLAEAIGAFMERRPARFTGQ
jgi:enoyl-CoA hydratase